MALTRTEAREKIMIILYQINLYKKNKINYKLEEIFLKNNIENNNFIKETITGVLTNEDYITSLANKYLNNWTLSRLGLTDQAIIKLSIYELLYTNTPPKVCIDEALNLSKQYSDTQVSGMINSVLDKVYHNEKKEK